MKLKIEATIEIDDNVWCSHADEEEFEWFISELNNKKSTMVILHNNNVGDTMGETFDFKWEIIKSE